MKEAAEMLKRRYASGKEAAVKADLSYAGGNVPDKVSLINRSRDLSTV